MGTTCVIRVSRHKFHDIRKVLTRRKYSHAGAIVGALQEFTCLPIILLPNKVIEGGCTDADDIIRMRGRVTVRVLAVVSSSSLHNDKTKYHESADGNYRLTYHKMNSRSGDL